jgi:hypothetical protein
MNVIFITSFMFIGIILIISIVVEVVEKVYDIKSRYANED